MSTLGWLALGYLGVGTYFYLSDRKRLLPGGVAACRAQLATMNASDPTINPNDPRLCQPPSPVQILTWPARFVPAPFSR